MRYTSAKEITMVWGQINGILDYISAFMFGQDRWELAIVILLISVVSSYLDNRLYFWVLEKMAKDKIEFGMEVEDARNGHKHP